LNVTPESNRWTNGKPRFKYTCPGYRKKECDFIAVDGVLTDEFVVKKLSEINDENSEYYYELIQERIDKLILSDENEREYRDTKKTIEKIKSDIVAQIKNMRDAPDDIKPFYQEDINSLTEELEKQKAVLVKIEALKNESRDLEEELKQVKKILMSFEEYAKNATPEVLTSLIHSVVEKIYVTTENSERVCHIFIKGCTKEDYSDLFGNAENADSKRLSEDYTNTCDDDGDCKRYSHLCWRSAQSRLQRAYDCSGV
jgi:site-specific DNA recombinase